MPAGILYDSIFLEHFCMFHHPERPERLGAALEGLERSGVTADAVSFRQRPATMEELLRVHSGEYVEALLEAIEGSRGFLDPDTFFSEGSREAALGAAGGSVDLVDAVHHRDVDWGVAVVRPPGHHASRSRQAGFCLLNNIGIAAASLLDSGAAERVVVFDWDVHHGNGTQNQFWNRPDLLFFSMHQWPHFPGSGLSEEIGGEDAPGLIVNVPFPAGGTDADYLAAIEEIALPIFAEFRPEHILVSAGFDAHEDDPLAGMSLTSGFYGVMADILVEVAAESADGRITLFLEGGYDLSILAESMEIVARALEGDAPPREVAGSCRGPHREIIERTKKAVRPYWKGIV